MDIQTRISISESTHTLLAQCARPLVDDYDSVISRLAKAWLSQNGREAGSASGEAVSREVVKTPAESPEDLAHTRVLSASVDGRELTRANWNAMVRETHLAALRSLGSVDRLIQASDAHVKAGKHERAGFRYVPEGDFSVQGLEANLAWRYLLALAKRIERSVQVVFEWRRKEGAQHPGRRGELAWEPSRPDGSNNSE